MRDDSEDDSEQSNDVMRDKTQLRENLYADPSKLGARVALHARFSTNPVPISTWELGLVDLSGVKSALDAGCGIGNFLLPLSRRLAPQGTEIVGMDLAEGTLGVARARIEAEGLSVTCMVGDVEALPFVDASFDLALANYMLYHVPHLDQAISELRRVLRSGGTLLAMTNGQEHMRELWQMQAQAFLRADGPIEALQDWSARTRAARRLSFRLETGEEWLRRHFAQVRLKRFPNDLRVTEAQPLVAYVDSMWTLDELVGAVAATEAQRAELRERVLVALREIAAERIAADGAVTITADTGAFVAC